MMGNGKERITSGGEWKRKNNEWWRMEEKEQRVVENGRERITIGGEWRRKNNEWWRMEEKE